MQPQHDPGLFVLDATLVAGITHEQVERALVAEVERVKESGVTTEELQRALNQYRADEAFGRDGSKRIAGDLNEWIAAGDWTYYVKSVPLMAGVTPADVQRVAKTYLVADHSTTGFYIPVNDK
jgi:zinc protease